MAPQLTFVLVYLALLALLAATIGASQVGLGPWSPVVNLGIAAIKTFLIAWFFMHVREGRGLLRLFAFGGMFWLMILLGLSLSDYLTRV